MKKLFYMLLLPLLIVSCVAEKNGPCPGESVELRGSIATSEYPRLRVSSDKEDDIAKLELWVFDEDGLFLERSVATVTGSSFKANVISSTLSRTIHFVANYTLQDPLSWVGRSQKEMLPALSVQDNAETICMWAMKNYSSISVGQDLGTIELLRNMAKYSVSVSESSISDLSDVSYALFNSLNKGTISPFDPVAGTFTEGFVTEPGGAAFDNPEESAFKPADGQSFFYGFERENKKLTGSSDKITCLIVKAKYKNELKHTYYKIDLVDQDKNRYNVIRNHFYKMTLTKALTAGKPSVQEALAGAAANNIALSSEVQTFPSFSDGSGTLTVDHTYLAYVGEVNTGEINASYIPKGSSVPSNNSIKVIRVVTPEGANPAVSGHSHDGNGKITLTLNPKPVEGALVSEVVIGIEGNPDLTRIVRVIRRSLYEYDSFTVNNSTVLTNITISATQGKEMTLAAKIPEAFNKALLPITFKVYTENFYPVTGGTIFGLEGGKIVYKYPISLMPANREIRLKFKSNKNISAENIKVTLDYFVDKSIQVKNS